MTPTKLAAQLGISPKTLRAWLRRTFPRGSLDHGTTWSLAEEEVRAACENWKAKDSAATLVQPIVGPKVRTNSDEGYVIDLCDELLETKASRQHRFVWLTGDVCSNGRRVLLPVDAFYKELGLVVEYRERQHDEPTPFFDRRQTVSGVGRGEQRRIYDQRRGKLIPEHGLRLVVIRPSQLDGDSRGRLRRNHEADRKAILVILNPKK